MKSLVLNKPLHLSLQEFEIPETMGERDVKIKIKAVGICGSDIHYYQHGSIGDFIVKKPLILGHEASGEVLEVGREVTSLKPGDRVCMEPGIPGPDSEMTRMGNYNLDPGVRFWATPPIHGCTRETVVHPAHLTYKIPDNVSFLEGSLVEPTAIGVYALKKAQITPGDRVLVIGAGTIGMVTALSANVSGASRIIISDIKQEKLQKISEMGPYETVNSTRDDLSEVVKEVTDGKGVDILFETSGNKQVAEKLFDYIKPGGKLMYIGMPDGLVGMNIVAAQVKEISIHTIFRYAHVYQRAVDLIGSGKIDVKPLISKVFPFSESVEAYEYAAKNLPDVIKVIIDLSLSSK